MPWSAEKATNAFLRTIKSTPNNSMEPDVAEFLSALAAGGGARNMIEFCSTAAGPTTRALISAAQQTGGSVVCVLRGPRELQASRDSLAADASTGIVELTVMPDICDALGLLKAGLCAADFVLVDCRLEGHEKVFCAARAAMEAACRGGVVACYNALQEPAAPSGGARGDDQLLPIGGGVRVCRVPATARKSRWVVRVDECTGEEHVFRITSQRRD